MPKIQEAELLKLRENDAADDKTTAKELIVDGAAYKVSQTGPVLAPGALPTAMQLLLIRLSAVATGGQQRTALALHGHALPAVLGQSANRFHPSGPEAAGAAQNLPHQGLPAGALSAPIDHHLPRGAHTCVGRGVRCQVLMAGAMRPDSAGLKSISAKHLALSSQSLGMFLTLMPHIKAVLAAYVPEAQRSLLKEMDSATADYEEHQQQLFSK